MVLKEATCSFCRDYLWPVTMEGVGGGGGNRKSYQWSVLNLTNLTNSRSFHKRKTQLVVIELFYVHIQKNIFFPANHKLIKQ